MATYLEAMVEGPVGTLRINRPAKKNAINCQMWEELAELLQKLGKETGMRVLIVRGGRRAFSAGADISEFGTYRSAPEISRVYDGRVLRVVKQLSTFPRPVLALIEGDCIGAGCELALSCDLRFATHASRFGISAAKLGIVYHPQSVKRLYEIIGPSKTKDLLFSGRLLQAEEAFSFGLIDRLVDEQEIERVVYDFAACIAENSLRAIEGVKRIVEALVGERPVNWKELDFLVWQSYDSDDYREGVQAFMEKRRPKFPESLTIE